MKFTESSERLIRGYYVAGRRVRATGVHMWTLPITAIKAVLVCFISIVNYSFKVIKFINVTILCFILTVVQILFSDDQRLK